MKRTYSLTSKLIAALTAVGVAGLGCSTAEDDGAEAAPGAREVTLEMWTNLPDDSGQRTLTRMGASTTTLDELMSSQRTFVVDGSETTDLARLRTGGEIVVPLNTGESATLVSEGDRLELAGFTGEDDGSSALPRGAVEAVRLLPDGIEVFLAGSDSDDADTIVRVSGLEDLDAERGALLISLALDTILVSLEDTEQIPPPVAIAIIVGIVGGVWLGICGSLAWYCADHCQYNNGFKVECAGISVSVDPPGATFGGGYSCTCT